MKKFLACILICSMSFGMTGCSVLEKVGFQLVGQDEERKHYKIERA